MLKPVNPRGRVAALHLRGVTAWVEREGTIAAGDEVTVHVPVQPRHPEYSE